jgi:hypothetical protein
MLVANYIILAIIIIALGILYKKFCEKQVSLAGMSTENYNEIRKYLLNDSFNESALANSKKPILWIHVPYEYNSRNWSSFGSRSSFDLNQPYLYLTVKSIIAQNDQSFHIVIIDDTSFDKLLPNWSVNLSVISDPILTNMRQLALAKLIHVYGGINVPISFLCKRDLIGLYEKGTNDDTMFVCENVNINVTATNEMFYCDARFMGAKKNNEMVRQYIHHIQQLVSNDYTAEAKFNGGYNKWINDQISKKSRDKCRSIRLIPGTDVGTKTIDEEPVIVDNLLNQNYIRFYENSYGIWIPADQILKRNNYEWFARLSQTQIFESNTILAKYIILTVAPNMTANINVNDNNNNSLLPDWISFWRVPATNGTLNVYGHMPSGLGDNVRRSTTTGSY